MRAPGRSFLAEQRQDWNSPSSRVLGAALKDPMDMARRVLVLELVSSFLFKKGSSIAEKSTAPDATASTKVDMANNGESMAKEVSSISKV